MEIKQIKAEHRGLAADLSKAYAAFNPPAVASERLRSFRSAAYVEESSVDLTSAPNHGLRWFLPPHDPTDGFAQRLSEGWLPVKELVRSRPYARGRIMLDIGANVGTNCIPRVLLGDFEAAYCAEPEPNNYAALRETVKANGLEGLVLPDRLAISDYDGEAAFKITRHGMARHRLVSGDDGGKRVRVPVRRLDTWIDDLAIDPAQIDFVKSDCQGHDGKVLLGAENLLALRQATWQIEYWPRMMERAGTSHAMMCAFLPRHFTHFVNTGSKSDLDMRPIETLGDTLAYLLTTGSFTELVLLNR